MAAPGYAATVSRRVSAVVKISDDGHPVATGSLQLDGRIPRSRASIDETLAGLEDVLAALEKKTKSLATRSRRTGPSAIHWAFGAHPGVVALLVIMLLVGAVMATSGYGLGDIRPPRPLAQGDAERLSRQLAPSVIRVAVTRPDGGHSGSGFFAAPNLVVTNRHVVDGASVLAVERSDGTSAAAALLARSADIDLALVCVPGVSGTPIPISAGRAVKGDGALMLGYPAAGPYKATPGTVSEPGVISIKSDDGLLLQIDVRPGNSGSAVVDREGSVIGIISGAIDDWKTGVAYGASAIRAEITSAGDRCHRSGS